MSFHFYLYRAPKGTGPMNAWQGMHAEAIGTLTQVRERLDAVFPGLKWDEVAGSCNGMGSDPLHYYLDLWLREEADGQVRFVTMNKALPSAMRAVLEALALNHVCAPEAGDLVDPYAYDDHDRYYARVAWPD
ncbi:hypothetical protein CSC74_15170 [Pseudoxanthomonas yeongjuensis]|uniref:hypothetical protein n=1 Tax=Pseudoxanthomonas yeongjuensis TaxID=377616 RepID=UPI001391F80F|nr:hypothetical protein [Pseudoxanthomonas yeongjuensis]KAF1714971.1 hypothetical protein CSC74_15170 [Pseudoxanthomonas yeongjuensis]